jgi:hypothetical protein
MNHSEELISLLKQFTEDQIGHIRLNPRDETKTERESPLFCKFCGKEVTASEYGTTVNGRHEHSFVNPSGIPYRIGCFVDAYGCITHGIPTAEFTWFAGFRWCFCSCAGCFSQLGWHYQSGERTFFGLILDNLMRKGKIH